jgi:4'-phosphopantetheinyl transferase
MDAVLPDLLDAVLICSYQFSAELHDFSKYWSFLSADERKRADALAGERSRRRFAVSRGILRTLLARFVDADPWDVPVRLSLNGKPVLALPNDQHLRFNISHSGDHLVLALTRSGELGIDIEVADSRIDYDQVVGRFYSETEIDEFAAIERSAALPAFYTHWTRKEAVVKAEGLVLVENLRKIPVGPSRKSCILLRQRDCSVLDRNYAIVDIKAKDNSFVGALALEWSEHKRDVTGLGEPLIQWSTTEANIVVVDVRRRRRSADRRSSCIAPIVLPSGGCTQ